jgi:hypothetical protein
MIRRRGLLRMAGGAAALAAPAITGFAQPATIHLGEIESLTGPSSRAHHKPGARSLPAVFLNAG